MNNHKKQASDYIVNLNMNGLRGRMLCMPASKSKKREILLLYGHHASLERMYGLVEELSKYGNVTLPDFPGFGGMESFYKINEKPTLDNLADYLAAFVKLKFKRKKITIMGMSFGFVVATKMLQKYPELTKKVEFVVSIVGFAHHDDCVFGTRNFLLMRYSASFFSNRLPSIFVKHFILRAPFIRWTYNSVADKHSKLKNASLEERNKRINFEINLWQINDIRTYMDTSVSMLIVDICDKQVDLDVYHVAVKGDRYFDNTIVEQHLGVIYKKVTVFQSSMKAHAPTVVADAKAAAPFMPRGLRKVLAATPS